MFSSSVREGILTALRLKVSASAISLDATVRKQIAILNMTPCGPDLPPVSSRSLPGQFEPGIRRPPRRALLVSTSATVTGISGHSRIRSCEVVASGPRRRRTMLSMQSPTRSRHIEAISGRSGPPYQRTMSRCCSCAGSRTASRKSHRMQFRRRPPCGTPPWPRPRRLDHSLSGVAVGRNRRSTITSWMRRLEPGRSVGGSHPCWRARHAHPRRTRHRSTD